MNKDMLRDFRKDVPVSALGRSVIGPMVVQETAGHGSAGSRSGRLGSFGDCVIWQVRLPEYVEAVLRGAEAVSSYALLASHLATCVACAEQYAELLTLVCWREAEYPFNRGVLPAPACRPWDL